MTNFERQERNIYYGTEHIKVHNRHVCFSSPACLPLLLREQLCQAECMCIHRESVNMLWQNNSDTRCDEIVSCPTNGDYIEKKLMQSVDFSKKNGQIIIFVEVKGTFVVVFGDVLAVMKKAIVVLKKQFQPYHQG